MATTAVGALMLGACAMTGAGGGGDQSAVADLITANGQSVGRATATQMGDGIQLMVEGRNMPPGAHGAHVHTVGRCDAPTFESAGGHWNPTTRKHGLENPAGPHAGDAPNLDVASDGSGTLTYTLPGGTFDGLFDADGSAMMIHAGPDDMMTDPSGNSGGRIACGIFRRA
ncbi:superoxide dismutase family protein [Sphingomonas sp.]|uniref:superoxide dismutase family protein n=1 Tax=Sphingomonas sp. TaxID=28214 RepID=UPI002CA98716|nr:superoxide dismutase family protein [Sphingomonas sp.]HTG38286.1 superoxide dismutase family protein [Sphingomonas sp.]